MSQCLRCSKLCEPTAVFCEECRSLLRFQLRQRPHSYASQQPDSFTNNEPPTLPEHVSVQGDPLERITSPLPSNRVTDLTQPQSLTVQPDLVEQAVTRLNEAAHLIEQEEDQNKYERKPRLYSRASRLSPIVDISADIRRESTPLPKIPSAQENHGHASALVDSNSALPDYWPWLDDDAEDKESDIWANRTDPLISRRIPTSAESARIEEEDMRRARADGISTKQLPVPFMWRHSSRLRIAFIALAIFAIMALIVDGILIGIAFKHSQHKATASNGHPTLTLSYHAASLGSTVNVKLNNFTPLGRVVLTHDIQEPILINGSSSITTDTMGSASFPLVINATWGPGFHLIVAEDVHSRSTASANLQIIGAGTTPPAHLLIDTQPLAMGADFVGTNTIRSFNLANSGGSSISWSANSDASWLLVAPSQGIFSQQETISVAVQRLGLKPGDYHGSLTISSNVSPPQHIEVDMSVRALPANAGPVLAVTPALLSFTATDGQSTHSQTLLISNPGSQALNWTLNSTSLNPVSGLTCNWIDVSRSTGTVPPGTAVSLGVNVQSKCLLPGTYIGSLTFNANGAIDTYQTVNISVVVQPHCGLVTSTGFLSFNMVAGQTALANQSFSLNGSASCAGTSTLWSYSRTASWISVTPGSGQLQGTTSSVVTASVNAAGLAPSKNPYYADLSFDFGQSSLTVLAQLTVQPAPPMSPIMSASPLSLNFSNIEGQPDPTGQVVTITNNGHSPLNWHMTATPLLTIWLGAKPAGGTIAPGQSGQVTVYVNTAQLTPGNYVGQITLNGTDTKGTIAPGSPQTIFVNLVVQPPCTLSPPSSSALSFSTVQGASANPAAQTVLFTGTGSCVWPLSWRTSVAPAASWLNMTSANTTITGTGQSGSLQVTPNISGLVAGTYSTTVTIAASDANGVTVQGGTQNFTVTLTVLPPCLLSTPTPATLAFSLAQGQTSSSALTVGLSESGTCARPVIWHASSSSSWLMLTATSGTRSSFGVNASAVNVTPGTYTGTITITATDSTGSLVGSAQSVAVTLTVTGFTISGTVLACTDQTCASSQALAGATVTIMKGSTTVATTTADASGNYSFSNMALGSYTITAAGYDGSNTHYTGNLSLTLTGNALNTIIQAPPG